MPRGDKSAYTAGQKRMAGHIEDSYESRGVPEDEARRRAWATVNQETGGGQQQRGRKGGQTRPGDRDEHERRSQAARKGWETRRGNAAAGR